MDDPLLVAPVCDSPPILLKVAKVSVRVCESLGESLGFVNEAIKEMKVK